MRQMFLVFFHRFYSKSVIKTPLAFRNPLRPTSEKVLANHSTKFGILQAADN